MGALERAPQTPRSSRPGKPGALLDIRQVGGPTKASCPLRSGRSAGPGAPRYPTTMGARQGLIPDARGAPPTPGRFSILDGLASSPGGTGTSRNCRRSRAASRPEHLPYGLRLAEVEPVVIDRAVELRAGRLLRGFALPAPRELGTGEAIEIRIGGRGDSAPPRPRLVEGRHSERFAVAELLHLAHQDRALRPIEPLELLLPREVADHPSDRIDRPRRRVASSAVTAFIPRIHSLRVNRSCVTSGCGMLRPSCYATPAFAPIHVKPRTCRNVKARAWAGETRSCAASDFRALNEWHCRGVPRLCRGATSVGGFGGRPGPPIKLGRARAPR